MCLERAYCQSRSPLSAYFEEGHTLHRRRGTAYSVREHRWIWKERGSVVASRNGTLHDKARWKAIKESVKKRMDTEWIQYFGARCPGVFNAAQFTHVTNTESVCRFVSANIPLLLPETRKTNLATIHHHHTFLCAGRRNVDKSGHWPADASAASGQGLLR
jgi:hypothetical protein